MSAEFGFPTGAVFQAALDAVIVMGADGRVTDWNPAAERAFGYTREEAVGRDLAELVIPPGLREAHRSGLERYIRTGRTSILDRHVELSALRKDGSEFAVELTVTRVPGTDPPAFAGFLRDLTEMRELAAARDRFERRLYFLAQAGAVLDRSLELDETLDRLAALTVPTLADMCVIDVLTETGAISCAAVAATHEDWTEALRTIRRRFPLDPAGSHPVAEVLRTGAATLRDEMSLDYLRTIAEGDEHFALMQRLHYRSAVVAPLTVRGRVLGTVSILRMHDSDVYGDDDLALAEELARRAAFAVDNARVYEQTRHVAVTLQQSLLPRSLPSPRGAEVVARYRAASDAQQVGGDFYDLFPIADRIHGLVIGDVCGKGAEAAALTAFARYTIRAAALGDPSPVSVLSVLNEAVRREQGPHGRFLTAVYAMVREVPSGLVLEVAAGGHPPPLVVRADRTVESVPSAGALLGVGDRLELRTADVTLGPGDVIVLYTDGLTDAGAPHRVLSEADISTLLAGAADSGPAALADLLEDTALSLGEPRDDIALVLIGVAPERAAAGAGPAVIGGAAEARGASR